VTENDPGNPLEADDLKADSGTDWGEDWESAFQAEDELFFPDLEEESAPQSGGPPTSSSETSPPAPETLPADLGPDEAGAGTEQDIPLSPGISGLTWIIAGAGGGLIVLFFALGLYLLMTDAPEQETALVVSRPAAEAVNLSGAPSAAPPAPRTRRFKVALKPFLIPVSDGKNSPIKEFLELELTLSIQGDIAQKDALKQREITLLRGSIYRFFHAIPATELHHYALARGEMLKKATQALNRAHPELSINSIIFNKYHLS